MEFQSITSPRQALINCACLRQLI